MGPLYAEKALLRVESTNTAIQSAEETSVPSIKYDLACALLALSQTHRLSSYQKEARIIGELALNAFIQIGEKGTIVPTSNVVAGVLANGDKLEKTNDIASQLAKSRSQESKKV